MAERDSQGQPEGQSRTVRWGQSIRWHRWERHHQTVEQLATRMLKVAEAEGLEDMPELDSLVRMIRRWERGNYAPQPRYRWLLTAALEATEADLFGDNRQQEEDDAERRTFTARLIGAVGAAAMAAAARDPIVQALARIHRLEGDLGDETMDSIEEAIRDLGLAHLRSKAPALERQIGNLLAYVEGLLASRRPDPLRRRLVSAAGWTTGLLANTQLDLGEVALARASCRAALLYGRQSSDDRLIAWARDRQAKIAYYAGDLVAVRRYVELGLASAPPRTSVRVGLLGAQARLLARFGNADGTTRTLQQTAEEYEDLPASEVGGGLLLISEIYPAACASAATAWLPQPEATIRRAQEVIDFFERATITSRRPTRVAIAQLDIASALTQQGKPDEACHYAGQAIGTERIASSVVVRADQLLARLLARWREVAEVRDFQERCLGLAPRPHLGAGEPTIQG
jgi:tetratricopeptide (TPR) repeat protein